MDIPSIDDLDEKFPLVKKIASGKFASIFLTKNKSTGLQHALKTITKRSLHADEKVAEHKFLREFFVLQSLNHPNIPKVYQCFQTSEMFNGVGTYGIVMDFVPGGNLDDYLKTQSLDDSELKLITHELINIFHYLFTKDIVHRDLKPANLIYNPSSFFTKLTLVDFGFAGFINSDSDYSASLDKPVGTPLYMAPEVTLNRVFNLEELFLADIWSLGVSLFYLFHKNEPYNAVNYKYLKQIMRRGGPKIEIDQEIPPKIGEIIKRSIVFDANHRANIDDLVKMCEDLV